MQGPTVYFISDIGCPHCSEVFQESGKSKAQSHKGARAALSEHLYLYHAYSRLHAEARAMFTAILADDEASDPAEVEDLARRQREYQKYDD